MGAYVIIANVAQHESIPRIDLTWDWKILGSYLPMKDLGTAIQKWPNQLAQSLPNLMPLAR
jgi:hypothetical protein